MHSSRSSILLPIRQWLFCFPANPSNQRLSRNSPSLLAQLIQFALLSTQENSPGQTTPMSPICTFFGPNFTAHKHTHFGYINLTFLFTKPSIFSFPLNSRILVFPRRPSSRTQLELTTSIDGHFNGSSIPSLPRQTTNAVNRRIYRNYVVDSTPFLTNKPSISALNPLTHSIATTSESIKVQAHQQRAPPWPTTFRMGDYLTIISVSVQFSPTTPLSIHIHTSHKVT